MVLIWFNTYMLNDTMGEELLEGLPFLIHRHSSTDRYHLRKHGVVHYGHWQQRTRPSVRYPQMPGPKRLSTRL